MTDEIRQAYTQSMRKIEANELIDLLGGTCAVAGFLGIKPSSVSEWRAKGDVPDDKRVLLAPAAVEVSQGRLREWDVCPSDWWRAWPELIGTPGAPEVPASPVLAQKARQAAAAARRAEEDRIRAAREAQAAEAARLAEQQQELARQQAAMIAAQRPPVEPEASADHDPSPPVETAPVFAQQKRTRPTDDEIIEVLALHYRVHELQVIEWLLDMNLEAASERAVELL